MTGREEHGRTSPRRNRLSVLRINRPSSRHASARRLRRGGDGRAVRVLGLQPGRGQIRHPRHPADDAGRDPLGRRGADRCRLGQGARAEAARARRHARRRAHRRPAVRLRIRLPLSGPRLHHGEPRGAVSLSRALRRRHRLAHLSARRPLSPVAMDGARAVVLRPRARLRRADARRRSAPGARRSDDGRRRRALGGDHAGDQGQFAQPHRRPKK